MELTGNCVIKLYKSIIVFFSILFTLLLSSCSDSLPTEYGVFIKVGKEYDKIEKVELQKKGNLNNTIQGLKEPSGNAFDLFEKILIHLPNVKPESIKLTQLDYLGGSYLRGVIGKKYYKIQLWVPEYPISAYIEPLQGKQDMYEIIPENKLVDGFYIIHMNNDGNKISNQHYLDENYVYDFVIGDPSRYLSYENMKKKKQERMSTESHILVARFNEMYNEQNFDSINYVYLPSNKIMSRNQKQKFIDESQVWFKKAGKILSVEYQDSSINEFKAIYEITTNYQNIGKQSEKFIIELNENHFHISNIK